MVAVSAEVRSVGSESQLEPGEIVLIKVLATSGANPTLSLGQMGAVPVVDEVGNVPPAGFLAAGVSYFGAYDGLNIIVRGAVEPPAIAVAATADGLTTGIIAPGAKFIAWSSTSAAFFSVLPTGVVGTRIRGWVGANGFKLSTPAASGATINNVNSQLGTASAVIPANTESILDCVAANKWLLQSLTALGAVGTAIVPS